MAFGRRKITAPSGYTPPSYSSTSTVSLITEPQCLVRSVPFVYDEDGRPAVDLTKHAPAKVSMVKSAFDAATQALRDIGLLGLRMQIILMVDGSGSMSGEYSSKRVQAMVVRALGFGLNVDPDKSIPVITYGDSVSDPVDIGLDNYTNAGNLIVPDYGYTDMAAGFEAALKIAREAKIKLPTMIINITDGNPYTRLHGYDAAIVMKNSVIRASGEPVLLKDLAIKSVPFLVDIDDMDSRYTVRTDPNNLDAEGNPKVVYDADEHVILDLNPRGVRLIDAVDSQEIDPSDSDAKWAKAFAEEVSDWLDASAQVGTITGVPGLERRYFD